MKTAEVCGGRLFTESYCNICNAQLISESQRTAHFESKKHANKVRLFYMLHPEDGGPPSKRLRPDNPDCAETEVDRNKCCTLCNMFFTSTIVAQSHYQGKTHAKRIRLVLGEPQLLPSAVSPFSSRPPAMPQASPTPWSLANGNRETSWSLANGNRQTSWSLANGSRETSWSMANGSRDTFWSLANGNREVGRFCCLCRAWFNNPLMAQQHYGGKKHKKNAGRAHLMEQLIGGLDTMQTPGLQSTYTCYVCAVTLNSIEQYYAHLQGSKHQNNLRQPHQD